MANYLSTNFLGISLRGWLWGASILSFFLLVTRAPELRVKRKRFAAALIGFCVFLYWAFSANTLLQIAFAFILIRLACFIFGYVWAEIVGHHVSVSIEKLMFGDDPRNPAEASVSFAFPKHLRNSGQIKEAIKVTRQRLAKSPHDFTGLMLLATIYAENLKSARKAKKLVQTILNDDLIVYPHKEYALTELSRWTGQPVPSLKVRFGCSLAHYYRSRGEHRKALQCLDQILAKNPSDVDAIFLRATIFGEDLQQLSNARRAFDPLFRDKHAKPEYVDLAKQRLAQWEEPKPRPKFALEGNPGAHYSVAHVPTLRQSGYYGQAAEILNKQLQSTPDDADVVFELATIQAEDCGNINAACKLLNDFCLRQNNPALTDRADLLVKKWRGR